MTGVQTCALPISYSRYNTERNIPILIRVNNSYTVEKTLSLSEGILKFIAAANRIGSSDPTTDFASSGNMHFINDNGRNEIVTYVLNSADLYMEVFKLITIEIYRIFR